MLSASTDTDTGTRQSRRRRSDDATPEETLARFRKENPDATAAELREIARDFIIAGTVFKSLAVNNFTMWLVEFGLRRIKDEPSTEDIARKSAERAAAHQQLIETMAQADQERIKFEASIQLLEWVTPYGKLLKECTGAECKRLGRRLGTFFAELGARLTPGETVGAHFPEAALQAIARAHRLIGEKAAR